MSMMRHFALGITLAGALLSSAGCSGPNRPAWVSINPSDWANRSEVDPPILLDVAGPVAVDVHSFNGNVTITGNPKVTHASVILMREGVHGYERVNEAIASLKEISCTADVAPGELGQVLRVSTNTTNAEPHYQRAHLFIELPEIDGVSVRTSNGDVTVRNISGRIDIATTRGEVRVMTNQPMNNAVTIINRDGDINYRVRGESTGAIDAQTVNGKVHHHVRYGRLIVHAGTRSDYLNASLNNGENPITLRTVNGEIRIAVVSQPEQPGDYIWH